MERFAVGSLAPVVESGSMDVMWPGTASGADDRARLEGVLPAVRTMEHHLGNQLGITYGYGEFLATDRSLPAHVREWAAEARAGTRAAMDTLQRLRRLERLVERDGVIDLERSAD